MEFDFNPASPALKFFFIHAYSISLPAARPISRYCARSGSDATSTALPSVPLPSFRFGRSSLEGGSARKNPVLPLAGRWLSTAAAVGFGPRLIAGPLCWLSVHSVLLHAITSSG